MVLAKAVTMWGSRPAGDWSMPTSRTWAEADATAVATNPAPSVARSVVLSMSLSLYRLLRHDGSRPAFVQRSGGDGPGVRVCYRPARSTGASASMPESPLVTAVGVISGTSMDGIDVSVVDTDG